MISAGVSWRKPMGYPSYARKSAYALPSPSPFHFIRAKIVPAVQLAVHAKSSTLHGQSCGLKSKFFRLDGLILFPMIMAITSKCVKNEKVAHEVQSNESLMFLPHFSTATWYLFVLYENCQWWCYLCVCLLINHKPDHIKMRV